MPPPQVTSRVGQLPAGFTTLRQLLQGEKPKGSFVKVVGVVTEFRPPIKFNSSTEFKAAMSLIDKSLKDSGDLSDDSLQCHFFLPENQMPAVQYGAIITLEAVKVQKRSERFSLISNHKTRFSIYGGDKIPKPPGNASVALVATHPARQRSPSGAELEYIPYLYHGFGKDHVPTEEEFKKVTINSVSTKTKFSELKDITEGYYDIVVQLAKEPYDKGDMITLYVTDYTKNSAFFNFSTDTHADFLDGDPDGYLKRFQQGNKKAVVDGVPHGQLTMQISCWEPHVSLIRDTHITKNDWLLIRNIMIKYGHNGHSLEGYLRDGHLPYGYEFAIFPLEITAKENMDLRLYSAIKRQRDYERSRRARNRGVDEAANVGQKRKSITANEEKGMNSKRRRQRERQKEHKRASKAIDAPEEASMATIDRPMDAAPVSSDPTPPSKPPSLAEALPTESARAGLTRLNPAVKCERLSTPASTVSELLQHAIVDMEVEGQPVRLTLPFVNRNHRVDVRVTDFRPSDLRDFSRPKRRSQFAVLSDYESSESDDSVMDSESEEWEWEWQFALELEDASPNAGTKEKFWAVVDNQEAQCLTNMDASDLSAEPENLDALRRHLSCLWGNLEDRKTARLMGQKRIIGWGQQPPDDSDVEDNDTAQTDEVVSPPFPCCVKQYGIKVPEGDLDRANAGEGFRWMRVFGLYGTRVSPL